MAITDKDNFISRENEEKLGRIPATDTLTLTAQSTEYSYAIPSGTKILAFKLRTIDNDVVYGFATGALNLTLNAGERRTIDNINLVDRTLFVQCNQAAGKVLEIEYWQ
mgnify:CR=1 FL=1